MFAECSCATFRNASAACDRCALRHTSVTCRLRDTPVTGTRHEPLARDLGDRAAPRQQRDAQLELHRALDAVEARQRDHHVERDVVLLEQPQHALARRRRIVVRDDRMPRQLRPSSPGGVRRARATATRAARARRCRPEPRAALLPTDGTSARRNRGCPAGLRPRSAAPAHGARRWRCRETAGGTGRSAAGACGRPLRWRRSARVRAAGRAAPAWPIRPPPPDARAAAP